MMLKLYWKIFLSFWITTILIIMALVWITSETGSNISPLFRERIFISSYANAAIATYESVRDTEALNHWLANLGQSHHMKIFVINSKGKVFGEEPIPQPVQTVGLAHLKRKLPKNLFKHNNMIVSQTIHTANGESFRVVALIDAEESQLLLNPIQNLMLRMLTAMCISGIICYLLSRYLTKPLLTLQKAAKAIANGQFSTRVVTSMGARKDEIAELGDEFDRMAQQLEQLASSKQRLIQDISHELRSPLARLQVAMEIARSKTNNLAENEFKRMELEASRLNELIQEIFSLAQLNKLMLKLALQPVDLLELLQDITKDANFEFSKNKPRVQLQPSSTLTIQLDKKLIHRALENVIRNALRYSAEDSAVEIALHYYQVTQPMVKIMISDHGPGVPEHELENIFHPFHRVDSSRTKQTGGYGLGLAIAKQAIQLHHGTIRAYNRPAGGGLIVEICLPCNQPGYE